MTMSLKHFLVSGAAVFALLTPTSQAAAADTNAGKAVYEKSCASCHGADGKGNPAMAKALGEKGLNLTTKDVTQKSDDQLLKVIADGAGKMPAQKSLSKDEQETGVKLRAVVSEVKRYVKIMSFLWRDCVAHAGVRQGCQWRSSVEREMPLAFCQIIPVSKTTLGGSGPAYYALA
jgi:cytochrome c5